MQFSHTYIWNEHSRRICYLLKIFYKSDWELDAYFRDIYSYIIPVSASHRQYSVYFVHNFKRFAVIYKQLLGNRSGYWVFYWLLKYESRKNSKNKFICFTIIGSINYKNKSGKQHANPLNFLQKNFLCRRTHQT